MSERDPNQIKAELRSTVRVRLSGFTAEHVNNAAEVFAGVLEQLIVPGTCWMSYRAIPGKVPEACPSDSLFRSSAVRVVWPAIDWERNELIPREMPIRDASFVAKRYGVPEPDPEVSTGVCVSEIDVVLVPGMAFDRAGRRLGRGGGFYDRFLALIPQAVRIGIAFEEQVVDRVPSESHDQSIDLLVTPSGLFRAENQRETVDFRGLGPIP